MLQNSYTYKENFCTDPELLGFLPEIFENDWPFLQFLNFS